MLFELRFYNYAQSEIIIELFIDSLHKQLFTRRTCSHLLLHLKSWSARGAFMGSFWDFILLFFHLVFIASALILGCKGSNFDFSSVES